jgi:hypothetical protein
MPKKNTTSYKYDVCLSFAGEDRDYVERVASYLRNSQISVFYDNYEQVSLWGKDLYVHLDEIYRKQAQYCVLFVSQHYAKKVWTNHERMSAQARAFESNQEYILPARFDKTEIPGVRPTIGYLNLLGMEPQELAAKIVEKVGVKPRKDYLPSDIDILLSNLKVDLHDAERVKYVGRCTGHIFSKFVSLKRDERRLLLSVALNACGHMQGDELHVYQEVVLRDTGFSAAKVKNLFSKMRLFGFYSRIDKSIHKDERHNEKMIYMVFHPLAERFEKTESDIMRHVLRTAIVAAYERQITDYCSGCALAAVLDANFSQLSTSTVRQFSVREHIEAAGE